MAGQGQSESPLASGNRLPSRLQSRSALPIKQYAAFAGWTEQPLPGSVIPEPERPTANCPMRHAHIAAWTLRQFRRVRRQANDALLVGGVFRKFSGHG